MKRYSSKFVDPLRMRHRSFANASWYAIAVLSLFTPCVGLAQTPVRHPSAAQSRSSHPPNYMQESKQTANWKSTSTINCRPLAGKRTALPTHYRQIKAASRDRAAEAIKSNP